LGNSDQIAPNRNRLVCVSIKDRACDGICAAPPALGRSRSQRQAD
jgi:hypothetical protein